MNRKLIRPSLAEIKSQLTSSKLGRKKAPPPEQTNAENFYYVKQITNRTPLVFILTDGESIEGVIEWYDRNCLKILREGKPNLVLFKSYIKYIYKQKEEEGKKPDEQTSRT
jgi:host factor-I protein